jgi:hypothetical protein
MMALVIQTVREHRVDLPLARIREVLQQPDLEVVRMLDGL